MWRLLVCIRRGCDSTEKASLRIVRHPHIEKDTRVVGSNCSLRSRRFQLPTVEDSTATPSTGLDSPWACFLFRRIGFGWAPYWWQSSAKRTKNYSSSTRSNHAVTAIKRNVDATSTTLRVGPWRPSWWEHQIDSSSHETKHDVRSFHFSKENASQVSILS